MPQNVDSLRGQSCSRDGFQRILLAATVLLTAATVLPAFSQAATGEQRQPEAVDALVGDLAHESPITRRRAANELFARAAQANPQDREQIVQTMLRQSLAADLETQLAITRLIDEIAMLGHRQNVDRIVEHDAATLAQSEWADSPVAERWVTFAARAGEDAEARATFRQLAWDAGPSLAWPQLRGKSAGDFRRAPSGITLISHLGCVAPDLPCPRTSQAKRVLSQIRQTSLAEQAVTRNDAAARVMGRLIDLTLLENPYGWTIAERLHLSLLYQRDRITSALCRDVLLAERPLAGDLVAAILARQQLVTLAIGANLAPPKSVDQVTGEQIAAQRVMIEQVIVAAWQDRRIVSVAPEQLVGCHRLRKTAAHTAPAIIRTRVQDIAAWSTLQDPQWDLRQHGMWGLQADPVWGIRLSSIGFTSEPERTAFLAWAKTVQAGS